MARIRTIKPEVWTDEKFVDLSPLARLLFIGLWNFVDEAGRGEYSPLRLKMQILPADAADVCELLSEIERLNLITVYAVEGKEFFQVNGFEKHQKTDPRYPSKHPSPPIPADSRPLVAKEKEREKEKEKEKERNRGNGANAPTQKRASQIPPNWKPSLENLERLRTKGFADKELSEQLERFLDFHRSKGSVFKDFDAAFRTWMAKSRDFARAPPERLSRTQRAAQEMIEEIDQRARAEQPSRRAIRGPDCKPSG